MKNLKYYLLVFLLGFLFAGVKAQDNNDGSLGLPGDNLNLYAVMKLFQESETLEAFEKDLNDERNHINNLDLDNDNNIDYIKVEDNVDGNVHTIVLKDAITQTENQDIAVFTVQRMANNEVQIQLVGDEELYGRDYIIEPNYEGDESVTPNPGYTGNTQTVVVHRTTYVEVSAWPMIHYIFAPSYVVWYSPWYYGYYPQYWHPWRPYYWHAYYGYHHNYYDYYYGHYRYTHHNRYAHWDDHYYKTKRSHSDVVYQHRQEGRYKNTYSRPDTRKEGVELYNKSHRGSDGRQNNKPNTRPGVNNAKDRKDIGRPNTRPGTERPATRPDRNNQTEKQGVNRPSNRKDADKSTAKPRESRPANRQDVNKSTVKQRDNKQGTRNDVNKSTVKQRENKQGTRNDVGKPSNRSENRKTTSKSDKSNRSSRSDKSQNNTDKDKRGR
jgi:hypothetical protein